MSLQVQIRKKLHRMTLDIRFEVSEGVLVLLGEQGMGKTMALQCIAGLESPDEGRILLNGETLYDSLKRVNRPPSERRIGCLFPEYGLFPFMTVEDNLHMALISGGKSQLSRDLGSRSTALARVSSSYLREYHLDGLGGCYPEALSEAQKIWASYARMMAAQPKAVLLDCPFTGLEQYAKAQIMKEIRDDLDKKQIPCVFAATERDEAYGMSRLICVLHEGTGELVQTKEDFFSVPETVTGAVLSGCPNVSDVRVLNENHAVCPDWGQVFCQRIRTKDLSAEHSEDAGTSLQTVSSYTDMQGRTWRHFDSETRAVGIRPEDLTADPGAEPDPGDYTEFAVHAPVVEEEQHHWNVYFRPAVRSPHRMLWRVEKTHMSREELLQVHKVYIRNDKILWLR